MGKNMAYGLLLISILGLTISCGSGKEILLNPPDNRPVYSIEVADATEVELLQEQLKLPVISVRLPHVFFYGDKKEILSELKRIGYPSPKEVNLNDYYTSYIKITGTVNEEELKRSGANLLNREKDHIVVYGTLSQLKLLVSKGAKYALLDYEIRPRTVEITVPRESDIQVVGGLQVDIFGSVRNSDGSFTIRGSAWDSQIDAMKKLNFTVKIN